MSKLGPTSAAETTAVITDVQAEDVARAIAGVIARKMIAEDGGFKSVDREELAQDAIETMWPSLLDEAKAAMKACGID